MEKLPATDLREREAPEDSFAEPKGSLVVEYAVDFPLDLFSYAALGLTM